MKLVSSNYLHLGSFIVQKKQASEPCVYIHAKPLHYSTNGTGRDTYIYQNGGGFMPSLIVGEGKNKFFN